MASALGAGNEEKYVNAFVEGLDIEPEEVTDDLEYGSRIEWDSVAHLQLINEFEEAFGISIETDDVIAIMSVAKGRVILAKYGVTFD
ncbi:MAG: acyl carrier protein [Propionibacteriaceae bacterium]|jgi:acyl carrier protein|nr:acyl carrier protein [Propionibacteriaceae bacterium]